MTATITERRNIPAPARTKYMGGTDTGNASLNLIGGKKDRKKSKEPAITYLITLFQLLLAYHRIRSSFRKSIPDGVLSFGIAGNNTCPVYIYT